jgi:NACHT/LRR/PYD domain-containing protein 1
MEESQSKQESSTKVAQHEGQEDVDPTFKTKKLMEVELMKHRVQLERNLKLSKYTKSPN